MSVFMAAIVVFGILLVGVGDGGSASLTYPTAPGS